MNCWQRQNECALALFAAVVPLGMVLSLSHRSALAEQPTAAMQPPDDIMEAFVGVTSCGAVACHGGTSSTQDDRRWNSAYSVWAADDPHADAFAVLYSKESSGILQRFLQHEGMDKFDPMKEPKTYLDALKTHCASCHATAPASKIGKEEHLADGVSCESCHGPASRWRDAHTTLDWTHMAAEQKYAGSWGIYDTESLDSRAAKCVTCHVGSAGDKSEHREVNHDLIAAGHPRLNFEFATYFANLPVHWNRQKDRERHGGGEEFEIRAWGVGQIVSATAALELLHARSGQTARWPELAEYDCFSCHQSLASNMIRHTALPRAAGPLPGRLGFNRWGSWYFCMPRQLAESARQDDSNSAEQMDYRSALQNLEAEMSKPRPDAARIQSDVQAALEQTGQLLNFVMEAPSEALTAALTDSQRELPHWDQAAQTYLALAAMAGWDSSSGHPLDSELQRLVVMLQFPVGHDSPGRFDQHSEEFMKRADQLLLELMEAGR